ncbi:unnamed protein product [Hydatigera taeniaeformis]|uniref:Protein phosphatase 1 regulatory subunit 22 n=1 Tax=Hydatigena taeniaeformis TaxID=6205 RepID=A0A0R3X247_HYDTA|nr:unnamed protein product [Hydatigera taeniaeformis]
MVRITEELVRRRAEHNEGEICTLEELALHQQNIEKIEFLNNNCKNLRILYLQNNLISKIGMILFVSLFSAENVNRLKELEYLNLALNNIETIENLEGTCVSLVLSIGCESLRKLELTVNFIGDLTSVDNLINLESLEELYLKLHLLMFKGICDCYFASIESSSNFPQLSKVLDGEEVGKSERIIAFQNLSRHYKTILNSQKEYFCKRVCRLLLAHVQAIERAQAQGRRETLLKKLEENNG